MGRSQFELIKILTAQHKATDLIFTLFGFHNLADTSNITDFAIETQSKMDANSRATSNTAR